ncbi:unnamed protein product [Rotaria socialis]|uniref:ABC transporter domain-containing protein n=1 Tax=Rotaria socialis TaxID=392032 RepID=A0A817ZLZ4_9BILA|nr:unnamed protein product [Rotaria socialis]
MSRTAIVGNHSTSSISRVSIPVDASGTLSFHEINYVIGGKNECKRRRWSCPTILKSEKQKQILFDISGKFSDGMNAIMGPTGCGKSSLLDVLADRKDPHGTSGCVLVDGVLRHPSYKYAVGYVVQENVFSETLTVRENLFFSANLRLPKTLSKREKIDRVLCVIADLGLESCANTRMGTAFLRGVSGGEKKRTCIGMELVLSPKILFLDEPTTGYQCETHENPTDFVLDILIDASQTPTILAKLKYAYNEPANHSHLKARPEFENNISNRGHLECFQHQIAVEAAQSLGTELLYVSQRTLRNSLRNPAMALAQVVVSIMIGFLVGLVFYDLKKTTGHGVHNRLAAALIVVVLIFVVMMIFSGFLIELTSVFSWLSWMQWVSALRYASNVLTINEFQGLKLCLPNQTDNGLMILYFGETGERLHSATYITKLLPFYKVDGDRSFGEQTIDGPQADQN